MQKVRMICLIPLLAPLPQEEPGSLPAGGGLVQCGSATAELLLNLPMTIKSPLQDTEFTLQMKDNVFLTLLGK